MPPAARLTDLAEATGDVFFIAQVAPELAVEFVSDSIEDLFGHPVAAFQEDPELVLRLVDPRDSAALDETIRATTGEIRTVELRWKHRAGHVVWTQVRYRRRRRPDGTTVVEGSARDIGRLHRALAELAQSEERYRLLAESSADFVMRTATDRTIEFVTPSVTNVLGWTPEELVGRHTYDLMHPDDQEHLRRNSDRLNSGLPVNVRSRVRHADGSYRWLAQSVRPIRDRDGRVIARAGGWRDITAEVIAQEALAESEAQYRLLAENASDVVFRCDAAGVLEWLSPSIAQHFGWRDSDLIGGPLPDLVHPGDQSAMASLLADVRGGRVSSAELRIATTSGEFRWVSITARPIADDEGGLVAFVGGWRDIQNEREVRQSLVRSEQRFRLAMEHAPTGIAVVDLHRRFVAVNPALSDMLDRQPEWLLARQMSDVLLPEDDALDRQMREELLSRGRADASREMRLVRSDGSTVWVQHAIGLQVDDHGVPVSFVGHFVNISEARRARERLQFVASHDALTELVNRNEMASQLEAVLARGSVAVANIAVLFIDVDNLKTINDNHGHRAGDLVLVTVARRIRGRVRSDDIVARVGGDEFVVALTGVHDPGVAESVAASIHEALREPIQIGSEQLFATVSVGIAKAVPGDDLDALMQHADTALYEAKASGRARTMTVRRGER